jgi:hypothetical protein
LVPLCMMLEARKGASAVDAIAIVWGLLVTYFSINTVMFYHDAREVLPVGCVQCSTGRLCL